MDTPRDFSNQPAASTSLLSAPDIAPSLHSGLGEQHMLYEHTDDDGFDAPTTSASGGGNEPSKKRKRQTLSCLECKRRKIKCDRNNPCGPCLRRGEISRCQWTSAEPLEVFVTRPEWDEMQRRVSLLESIVLPLLDGGARPSTGPRPDDFDPMPLDSGVDRLKSALRTGSLDSPGQQSQSSLRSASTEPHADKRPEEDQSQRHPTPTSALPRHFGPRESAETTLMFHRGRALPRPEVRPGSFMYRKWQHVNGTVDGTLMTATPNALQQLAATRSSNSHPTDPASPTGGGWGPSGRSQPPGEERRPELRNEADIEMANDLASPTSHTTLRHAAQSHSSQLSATSSAASRFHLNPRADDPPNAIAEQLQDSVRSRDSMRTLGSASGQPTSVSIAPVSTFVGADPSSPFAHPPATQDFVSSRAKQIFFPGTSFAVNIPPVHSALTNVGGLRTARRSSSDSGVAQPDTLQARGVAAPPTNPAPTWGSKDLPRTAPNLALPSLQTLLDYDPAAPSSSSPRTSVSTGPGSTPVNPALGPSGASGHRSHRGSSSLVINSAGIIVPPPPTQPGRPPSVASATTPAAASPRAMDALGTNETTSSRLSSSVQRSPYSNLSPASSVRERTGSGAEASTSRNPPWVPASTLQQPIQAPPSPSVTLARLAPLSVVSPATPSLSAMPPRMRSHPPALPVYHHTLPTQAELGSASLVRQSLDAHLSYATASSLNRTASHAPPPAARTFDAATFFSSGFGPSMGMVDLGPSSELLDMQADISADELERPRTGGTTPPPRRISGAIATR